MGFIRFVVWTGLAVGLGVFISTFQVGGKTPLEHAQQQWQDQGRQRLDQLTSGLSGAVEDARSKVDGAPHTEHYSPDDRAAINKLIARGSEASKK